MQRMRTRQRRISTKRSLHSGIEYIPALMNMNRGPCALFFFMKHTNKYLEGLHINHSFDFKLFSFDNVNIFTNSRIASNFFKNKDNNIGGEYTHNPMLFNHIPGKKYSWKDKEDHSGIIQSRIQENQNILLLRNPEDRLYSGLSQVIFSNDNFYRTIQIYRQINFNDSLYLEEFVKIRKDNLELEKFLENLNSEVFIQYIKWNINTFGISLLYDKDLIPHHQNAIFYLLNPVFKFKIIDFKNIDKICSEYSITGSNIGRYNTSTSYLKNLVRKALKTNFNHSSSIFGLYVAKEIKAYNFLINLAIYY